MKRYKKLVWFVLIFCNFLWGAPYTNNTNGTVTDSATGLLWQRCSAGQGTTLGNCSTGSALLYTWSNAITYCEGLTLGGRSDWRLPNLNELVSIIDYTKSTSPTINSTAFPNTQSPLYWSSSTYAKGTNAGWVVAFGNDSVGFNSGGGVYAYNKTDQKYVRCVAGP